MATKLIKKRKNGVEEAVQTFSDSSSDDEVQKSVAKRVASAQIAEDMNVIVPRADLFEFSVPIAEPRLPPPKKPQQTKKVMDDFFWTAQEVISIFIS